ncbi:hypothetical protein P10VF_156 [Rhizobium phage vB_RleM_P10VF]|uniref:Uncharacterized protein n=2 Tax=Innesvirus TaxID=3044739 RepID=A0A076YNJ5_9CAUD|nr:hypothetical protein P10VF_156 [Rhizobium phage vB_RleM_P10VF]YP_010662338.1 hypothetical protein PP938_gp188 [Rhizobium phage AF3]AIK68369.1 hypothetical protein P10VF_156 [Rhizobium phage vB_RleM_P10VF]QNH71540.1 hypothetical protein AF3_188 [Rhizobium phage AF3]
MITDNYDDFLNLEEIPVYFIYVQSKLLFGPDRGKIYTTRLPNTIFDPMTIQQIIDEDKQTVLNSFGEEFVKHRKYRVYKTLWTEIEL